MLGANGRVQGNGSREVLQSVQRLLRKQPRGPWRKQAPMAPQTACDAPKRVEKATAVETEPDKRKCLMDKN